MLGGILALMAAATFGLNSVAIRRGVLSGSIAQGLAITVPIGVPLFFAAVLVTGNLPKLAGISDFSWLMLVLAGVSHFIIGRYANYRSTRAMGANLAGPVQTTSLILTLVLAIIFLEEVMTPLRVLGILLIILGPVIALRSPGARGGKSSGGTEPAFKPKLVEGYIFAIICALAFGTTPIYLRAAFLDAQQSGISNGLIGGLVAYGSAFILVAIYLIWPSNLRHAMEMNKQTLKWFTFTGLFVCTSQMLRFMALAVAPVSVVSPIIQTYGIFRTLFGWFINQEHEIFDAWILTSVGVTILGAVVLTMSVDTVFELMNLPEGLAAFLRLSWP